jgi:hypothetical protein
MRTVDEIVGDIEEEFISSMLEFHVRYKVLTTKQTSTGLLHSSIIKYKTKRWTFPEGPPIPGKVGRGGLWASRNIGMARGLQKYLKRVHDMETRIHLCIIDKTLFQSSYRTKTNRLLLLDPIERWRKPKQ